MRMIQKDMTCAKNVKTCKPRKIVNNKILKWYYIIIIDHCGKIFISIHKHISNMMRGKIKMSTKIILFPVGSEAARNHYENSIIKASTVDSFSEYLDSKGLDRIYYGENQKISLWGISSTRRLDNIYKMINQYDLVMFVQDKKIISFAMVLMKIESSPLSEKYWGSNEWSNIIFLTEVNEDIDLLVGNMWNLLGYMDSYILRGPLIIKPEKSNAILQGNEKLSKYLDRWIEDSKSKRPQEGKRSIIVENFNPKIFISYAHSDEQYKNELKNHLSILLKIWKAGEIWDDRKLEAGIDYNEQINKNMDEDNICILLISSDYFASKDCMEELEKIIKRDTIIIPIIVRSCYWKKLFSNTEKSIITFPQNKSNIFASKDKDEEFKKIVEYIDDAITKRLNHEEE